MSNDTLSPAATMVTDHKWEASGVGSAPYRIITVIEVPSASLAEHNVSGYNNAMRGANEQARAYGVSLCSCNVCGMSLQNNVVVRNAEGNHFVVGLDCARKSGDHQLVTQAKKVQLQRDRAKREEKREQRRMESIERHQRELEAQRQRNGGLTDAEVAEKVRQEELEARRAVMTEKNGWLIDVLVCQRGDFCESLARELETSEINGKSDRVVSILRDIYAKSHGRRGSKKYEAAYDEFGIKANLTEEDE